MSAFLENPALMGGIAGGLATLLFFSILFLSRAKFLKGSRWGMNFSEVTCPECGKPLPKLRIPKNWRQFWWGGWSCESCGKEFDKWLKPIDQAFQSKHERMVDTQNGRKDAGGNSE